MTMRSDLRKKWRNRIITPSNIDEYMKDLYEGTPGQYVTLGVSFNKDDHFQMELIKQARLTHKSFSGLVKHLLFMYFSQQNAFQKNTLHQPPAYHQSMTQQSSFMPTDSMQESFEFEDEDELEAEAKAADVDLDDEVETAPKPSPTKTNTKPRANRSANPFLKPNPNAKPSTQ